MQNYTVVPVIGYGFTPNSATVAANNGTLQIGNTKILAMPIPSDNLGGGITITSFTANCHGTVAANVMGLYLVAMGSTYAAAATVASLGSLGYGGTSNYGVSGTIATAWIDQDDGYYYLALEVDQVAVLAIGTSTLNAVIGWQQGR